VANTAAQLSDNAHCPTTRDLVGADAQPPGVRWRDRIACI